MGLFFALPEVTEGNVVKIPQSMLDDDDEIEDDMMGTRKGNKTIFTKKTTKHTKARGCCAGGGKIDLFVETVVVEKKDGTRTKYKERRYAQHCKNGARIYRKKRYVKQYLKNGKKTKYKEVDPNEPNWPR
uniref:Uncharacterized protein n=1 Tax=Lotharella globosa TaxID=91324 RepID=A0A6U3CUW7_9EUKA|mmetsp:Transcript_36500/g.70791  ORF Transcript_36500/g.70791 Transcript_36500/m.70791 type:complete len:130 (+) Transcript_36500:72-461(+)|eukprot:CAMPEP_0167784014 /NCGR_PEP_ID=MMETSP0111_2-20121227/7396_1 /TAXON_ID=91324 /ORGANISM="Lotharella globosa, Strain CCCM811" /LENGTH=129 /DNA_ID=CAMNT_0007675027 /DNA_START=45 /DNA_END=434 /DNA_ORIENTATION=-